MSTASKEIQGVLQAPTLKDPKQNHHNRDDQQNVYESAHGV